MGRRSGRRGYKRMKKVIRRTVFNMAETKSATLALATVYSPLTTTWVESILIPSQGGLSTQMIGRRYELIGFTLFGTLAGGQSNSTFDDKYNIIRIIAAVFDGDAAGAATTSKWPIMSQGPTTPVRLKSPIWPADGSTQAMRRILKSKLYTLVSPGRDSTGYMPVLRTVKFSVRLKKPLIVNYTNEGGGIRPDKYVGIGMVTDSSATPSPGFISGTLTWWWKDL